MSRRRIRSLKPEFFEDEKVCAISRDARLVTIGLITLADDRGRLRHQPLAIVGDLFPEEAVSVRQLNGWMAEIIEIGLAIAYAVGSYAYLWLPRFLRHQVVNKPTESLLPPHPDDQLAEIPIAEAFKAAKRLEDSGSAQGSLLDTSRSSPVELPTHTRVRSVPIPSGSEGGSEEQQRSDARAVDQDEPPSSLSQELRPATEQVLRRLTAIQAERGGSVPTLRGVGLAVVAYPDRDLDAVVSELEHWALAGHGQRRPVKDWARTYRTFLERSAAASPTRPATVAGRQRKTYDHLLQTA